MSAPAVGEPPGTFSQNSDEVPRATASHMASSAPMDDRPLTIRLITFTSHPMCSASRAAQSCLFGCRNEAITMRGSVSAGRAPCKPRGIRGMSPDARRREPPRVRAGHRSSGHSASRLCPARPAERRSSGAEGIAGAFREPLHELLEQRFIGPRYHGRDEQALCLRPAFADASSTEPFEHQFQPSPTGVRRSRQKDVQVPETAGQESWLGLLPCSILPSAVGMASILSLNHTTVRYGSSRPRP